MATPIFSGVIPPVPTILTADEQLDRPGMARLIDHVIEGGVNGVFFLGSAGEFAHMGSALRHEVAEFCTAHVAGRVPVLIGAAHPGTRETQALITHAHGCGADGVVVVNPYYNPLSEENLGRYYQTLADASPLPILLYNFPALTGQNIPVSLIKTLAERCPNIVGLKDTVDTLSHLRETIQAVKPVRPDFAVFAGYDEYLFGTLILGGDGCIPASANFAPELTCGIYRAWQAQEFGTIIGLQQRLSHIPQLYSLDLPFYNVVKEAISQVGVDIPVHSLQPAQPLSEEKRQVVREVLRLSGMIG
ncbi:dihydrodipicolinate synthase family protein [Chimaeribacter coloradensis]|uniref:Dihydrodipicolinate synthase family protein n=1 Tax=Chimaeribacter coloradensis TaxID=2060068 RepID=A0A2N5EAN3_9GAMM|nr:dihydrodipicolinate synthase family protein [Chimaeribacter coloradensis]PLR39193.1 dihydrodipicolinate synthase family protein [Chimaeribacter coloradensis]